MFKQRYFGVFSQFLKKTEQNTIEIARRKIFKKFLGLNQTFKSELVYKMTKKWETIGSEETNRVSKKLSDWKNYEIPINQKDQNIEKLAKFPNSITKKFINQVI